MLFSQFRSHLIELPFTYTTKNFNKVAQELNNIHITSHHKMTTLDIKGLYVNLPIQNIINITKFGLNKKNNETTIIKQTLNLIKVILNQNYFQYNDTYFQPTRGIAMVHLL
jgi:hypothetical protein